jgi:hypothetical protein
MVKVHKKPARNRDFTNFVFLADIINLEKLYTVAQNADKTLFLTGDWIYVQNFDYAEIRNKYWKYFPTRNYFWAGENALVTRVAGGHPYFTGLGVKETTLEQLSVNLMANYNEDMEPVFDSDNFDTDARGTTPVTAMTKDDARDFVFISMLLRFWEPQ